MRKIEKLSLCQATDERAGRTCGPYYYLVTQGALSFTAYCSRYGFLRWLNLRGLKLTQDLSKGGEGDYQRLEGHFYQRSMTPADFEQFASTSDGIHCYELINARYVPAISHIYEEDGARIISYPWSGVGEEPCIDYWAGRAIEDGKAFKGKTPGPDWLFETPEEIVQKGGNITGLTQVEMAVLTRAWLELQNGSQDEKPLGNPTIMRRMLHW